MFKPGDRVVVTATKATNLKYVGVTGTCLGKRSVAPDQEWVTPDRPCAHGYWWFADDYYTLELFDDPSSHIPENWS